MSLISVQNLKFKYNSSPTFAVDDVSFEIEEGSYTAIVGFNGSGKSTIARIICGLEKSYSGSVVLSKNIRFGVVFQSPKDQIVSGVVYRDTSFGPQNLKLKKEEVELRTIECLNITDLLHKAENSTGELSLGQTQKLALAGSLAIYPEVLILDEAISMLDPESRKDILEFVKYWHLQGNTIIQITHDMEVVNQAEKIIGIESGKVFFDGTKQEFLQSAQNIQRITGNPLPQKDKSLLPKCKNKEISLRLKNINFAWNEKSKIQNVSFDLYKGTITALTGSSGAGKSTILELCSGLLQSEKSENSGIFAETRPVLAQQNCQAALFEAFAADDVAFGPRNKGISGKNLKKIVEKSMNCAGLPFEKFGERHTFELSGGEQRRLSIAGILAMDADIVLFDEPTAGLDSKAREEIMKMFQKLADEGKTVLFSTHKMDEAGFADREIKIENGRLIYDSAKFFDCKNDKKSDLENKTGENLKILEPYPAISMLKSLNSSALVLSGSKNFTKKPFIQKFSPVLRIILFLLIFVFSLAVKPFWACVLILGLSIFYGFLSGFSVKSFLNSCLKILPFLLFFAVLQLIFHPPLPDEVRFTSWKFLTITPSKIFFCAESFLKTFAALACIFGFYFSTPDYDLIDGMNQLLKPFALVKIPVQYLILIMEVMFRFIPLLVEEASSIIKTQIMRGGMGKIKGKMAKIRAIVPLIVPIIIQTIKKSEKLSDAITMRCFK